VPFPVPRYAIHETRNKKVARSRPGYGAFVPRAAEAEAEAAEAEAEGDARVIVITSGKGGVGKTTTSANLGMSIARLGYRVCLVDADIGLRNLDLLLGLENRVMYTAMEVLEGECRMEQALIRDKRWRSLALLPISKNRQKYNVTKDSMNLLIDILRDMKFQYIFIDCPAGIDVGFINAIAGATESIIVTTPEITAIRDADRVAGLLEANGIYDVKLVVNRVRAEMIKKNDMMSVKDVQEMLGVPLLGAIPEDTEVIVSTNRGEPLVLKKKLTLAGIAYENAARRVVGKQDFLIDLDQPKKGLLQRTKEFFTGSD
jgi:septum site-determining protein MinD